MIPRTHEAVTIGAEFARALAVKDFGRIRDLMHPETDAFADCARVGYRFSVRNPDGRFLVEQQAYLTPRDGRIGWMRVVCSGYRPDPPAE
jgi:hypothetical protein